MATWTVVLKDGSCIEVEANDMVTQDTMLQFIDCESRPSTILPGWTTNSETIVAIVSLDSLAYVKLKAECECCEGDD